MADTTKNDQTTENTTQAPDNSNESATATAANPKKPEMVKFSAPYHPGALENDLHLIHNGKPITVKRGEEVKIPRGHKKVYDRSQRLLKEAQERARKRQEQYKNAGK